MRVSSLIIVAFIGYGCAAKRIMVSNADLLLENQIEKRLPLYAKQKEELSKDVDVFLNDQKAFATEFISVINKIELDPSKVESQYSYLHSLYNKLALNFSKLLSKHMASLDQKQSKEFLQKLKDENKRLKRKQNDAVEKTQDNFEKVFGTINDKQISIFKAEKKHIESRHELRINRREKLHREFMEIFKLDLSPGAKSKYFYEAFAGYQSSYPNTEKNKEIIKKIIPTLSREQKEIFEEKIDDLKEILNLYLDNHY